MAVPAYPWTLEHIPANGCVFDTAVAGEGERLALLLHGFPETHYSWREQIPVLAHQGYTVWAPNLRGYGGSSRPSHVADYSITHLLGDVAGLMDTAMARGLRPSLLLAHDWGGVIGWMFVSKRLRPVDCFIAVNIPHPALYWKNILKGGQIFKSWYILAFQIPWLPEMFLSMGNARAIKSLFLGSCRDRSRFPDAVTDVYRRNAALPGCARAMVNYYRANLGFGSHALREDMSKPTAIDVPTLIIWGEEDVALSVRLLDGMEDVVSDLTVRRLPGVSHWAQQEAPEAVNAAIVEWLRT